MSYPLVPPPASDTGAWSVPRTLQRWLDINPVTCLTRTQAFITLPAFNVTFNWLGYSDIVAAFNYEGPNNFSLTGFNIEPSPAPNYLLCIMWIDENHTVHRYSLWRGVGEVIYFTLPVYTGQKIAKNFRFEIWSTITDVNSFTNIGVASNLNSMQIYTSVLGKSDYRWGTDFTLINNDAEVDSFGATLSISQAVFISGAGDSGADGAYRFVNNNLYLRASPLSLSFNIAGPGWDLNDGSIHYYASADLLTWTLENGTAPAPAGVLTHLFNLPLIFPAGSYPVINAKQIYTPQPNYI